MTIRQAVRLTIEAGLPDYFWVNALPPKLRDAHGENEDFARCSGQVARTDFYVMWHREHSKKVT